MERYELDDESWHMRELYAKFGLAHYYAQVFEVTVFQYRVSVARDLHKPRKGPFDGEAEWQKAKGQSLGANLDWIKRRVADWPRASIADEVLEMRNDLTHHLWRTRIFETSSEAGIGTMIDDLEGVVERFQEVDALLSADVYAYMLKHGISPEYLAELAEEARAVGRGERPVNPDWIS